MKTVKTATYKMLFSIAFVSAISISSLFATTDSGALPPADEINTESLLPVTPKEAYFEEVPFNEPSIDNRALAPSVPQRAEFEDQE